MSRTYGVKVRRSVPLRLSMHPDAPPPGMEVWKRWVRQSERPIAVDLFCGAGGLTQGLEDAGYRVALSVDLDEWALETHAHNFQGTALRLDLSDETVRRDLISLLKDVEVDVVAGGPPCQPFSRAGRYKIRSLVDLGVRDEVDTRKELWRAFIDIVEGVRPRAVLMENVPDMALGDDIIAVRHILGRFERAGYESDARVVDTSLYGVPQHRQRLILVGIRDSAPFAWPEPGDRVPLRDAIADLPHLDVKADTALGSEAMPYEGPCSEFSRRARKQCFGERTDVVHDHVTRAVRPDDLRAFKLMKAGTLYSDLPQELRRYRDDIFDDKYNRLAWGDLSRSITAHIAKDGYWYIHPDQHRTLTVREAARIQTFPDHFRFAGSRSDQFAQIGNAVPPALAEAIGATLLQSKHQPQSSGAENSHQSIRVSQRRQSVRRLLGTWASADREQAPWSYPTDFWPALVGLILDARGDTGWPTPADVLKLVPSFERATPQLLRCLREIADVRQRKRMQRLEHAAESIRLDPHGWSGQDWRICLGPAARRWFGLFAEGDMGLALSTASLRVTSRLTKTDVDLRNRNSAGRMEVAKIIGGESDAPVLNAALHRLGTAICTSVDPTCQACPLRGLCSGPRE